jgi:hypothetical protein
MVVQIEITAEQSKALEKLASVRGQSVSDLIVESVTVLLGKEPACARKDLRQQALGLSGRFRSGLTDLSTHHDRYLGEDFGG